MVMCVCVSIVLTPVSSRHGKVCVSVVLIQCLHAMAKCVCLYINPVSSHHGDVCVYSINSSVFIPWRCVCVYSINSCLHTMAIWVFVVLTRVFTPWQSVCVCSINSVSSYHGDVCVCSINSMAMCVSCLREELYSEQDKWSSSKNTHAVGLLGTIWCQPVPSVVSGVSQCSVCEDWARGRKHTHSHTITHKQTQALPFQSKHSKCTRSCLWTSLALLQWDKQITPQDQTCTRNEVCWSGVMRAFDVKPRGWPHSLTQSHSHHHTHTPAELT